MRDQCCSKTFRGILECHSLARRFVLLRGVTEEIDAFVGSLSGLLLVLEPSCKGVARPPSIPLRLQLVVPSTGGRGLKPEFVPILVVFEMVFEVID